VGSKEKTEELSRDGGGEKNERPLFTCGEGKKRMYGKTTWSMEGLDYFCIA
jgi:hypothetical protein